MHLNQPTLNPIWLAVVILHGQYYKRGNIKAGFLIYTPTFLQVKRRNIMAAGFSSSLLSAWILASPQSMMVIWKLLKRTILFNIVNFFAF